MFGAFLPSLPIQYFENEKGKKITNPSPIYKKWIKKGGVTLQRVERVRGGQSNTIVLERESIGSSMAQEALKDAHSQYYANGMKHDVYMEDPHIIKLVNADYDIIEYQSRGQIQYGIAFGDETGRKRIDKTSEREHFLMLITSSDAREKKRKVHTEECGKRKHWGLRDALKAGRLLKVAAKERSKDLNAKRVSAKKNGMVLERQDKVKAGLGTIIVNLLDSTVSIPVTIDTHPEKRKADEKKVTRPAPTSFTGIDRNQRPQNYVASATIELVKPLTQLQIKGFEEMYLAQRRMCTDILDELGVEYRISIEMFTGLKSSKQMKHIKYITKQRQHSRKPVGHRVRDIQNTTAHVVSSYLVNNAHRRQNGVLVFEKLNFEKAKLRRKNGGKSTKSQRRMLGSWNYGDLKEKTAYKLKSFGLRKILEINAAYSSQNCHKCGARGVRDNFTNKFHCENEHCGYGCGSTPSGTVGRAHGDVNASLVIALRGLFLTVVNTKRREELKAQIKGCVVAPNGNNNIASEQPLGICAEASIGVLGVLNLSQRTSDISDDRDANGKISRIQTETLFQREQTIIGLAGQSLKTDNPHRGSAQPIASASAAGEAPENGISSLYKQNNNFAGRTELGEKNAMREVLSQTEF